MRIPAVVEKFPAAISRPFTDRSGCPLAQARGPSGSRDPPTPPPPPREGAGRCPKHFWDPPRISPGVEGGTRRLCRVVAPRGFSGLPRSKCVWGERGGGEMCFALPECSRRRFLGGVICPTLAGRKLAQIFATRILFDTRLNCAPDSGAGIFIFASGVPHEISKSTDVLAKFDHILGKRGGHVPKSVGRASRRPHEKMKLHGPGPAQVSPHFFPESRFSTSFESASDPPSDGVSRVVSVDPV